MDAPPVPTSLSPSQLRRFATSGDPLLILGERGTGKSTLARWIHAVSGRRGPIVEHALGALAGDLSRAELFGYRKGAFTGAEEPHTGLVESAAGGTCFLDELGHAVRATQQQLLDVVERGVFTRIGEVRPRRVDVRFVFATNTSPEALVREHGFLPDLLDRIAALRLVVRPLRDRREEIDLLATRYLAEEWARVRTGPVPVLGAAVRRVFRAASWPGNLRELRAQCTYAALCCEGEEVGTADLEPGWLGEQGDAARNESGVPTLERVRQALVEHQGNRAATARAVGLSRRHVIRLASSLGM